MTWLNNSVHLLQCLSVYGHGNVKMLTVFSVELLVSAGCNMHYWLIASAGWFQWSKPISNSSQDSHTVCSPNPPNCHWTCKTEDASFAITDPFSFKTPWEESNYIKPHTLHVCRISNVSGRNSSMTISIS